MIVIFASAYDESSYSLADRWSDQNAAVLTCNDLSLPGWRYYLPLRKEASAVIGGQVVPVREIKGALIRWPGVFEQELNHIAIEDRDYVAREMMSFLVAWFSRLHCAVINQPSPVNLAGPAWRPEHWTYAAVQVGLPVQKVERHVSLGISNSENDLTGVPKTDVTVVGHRTFGDVDDILRIKARQLAHLAGVSLLRVSFAGPNPNSLFLGADLLPQLSDEMADALLEDFENWEARAA